MPPLDPFSLFLNSINIPALFSGTFFNKLMNRLLLSNKFFLNIYYENHSFQPAAIQTVAKSENKPDLAYAEV